MWRRWWQHPTQTLLDSTLLEKESGQIDNLKIALVGDLMNKIWSYTTFPSPNALALY